MNYSEQDLIHWKYNCYDIVYTLEVSQIVEKSLTYRSQKLQDFYKFQQLELMPAVVHTMNTGVKIDLEKKELLHIQLTELLKNVQEKLDYIVGEPINLNSPKQLKTLFKDLLGIKLVIDKKSKSESCASAYMFQYLDDYPEYKVLLKLILEYRSIGVFLRTFVNAQVDEDGRMRTSYNPAGTKTNRLSSRKNAFGMGANLANIPSKGKIDLKYSLQESPVDSIEEDAEPVIVGEYEGITELPNCKEFFIPNEGYMFFNADYSGADAMVVAWDSDCNWLKNFFRTSEEKLYVYIGSHYLQKPITVHDKEYKLYKQFIHGTNYGMMEAKAAANAGMPLNEAKKLRQWYFSLCPEIPDWHKRIASDVKNKRYITNIFGAEYWFFKKDDPTILNQAYATIPQSTIAILVNKGWVNIYKNEKDIQVLLQVHDALAGQFPVTDIEATNRIIKHMGIELPYKDKLIIPVDITTSRLSYGHCC